MTGDPRGSLVISAPSPRGSSRRAWPCPSSPRDPAEPGRGPSVSRPRRSIDAGRSPPALDRGQEAGDESVDVAADLGFGRPTAHAREDRHDVGPGELPDEAPRSPGRVVDVEPALVPGVFQAAREQLLDLPGAGIPELPAQLAELARFRGDAADAH